MMRRDETYRNSVCVEAVVWDTDARTIHHEVGGEIVSSRPMTDDEWAQVAPFPSLDAVGALATLLVVDGVVALQDAANAIREEPEHLVHEAQAWGVG